MNEKKIILAARILSMAFTPFYLPMLGLLALFTLSYLSQLPFAYKASVMGLVYLFTILMPTLIIHFYRRSQGWNLTEMGRKERRIVPYIISILCYFACYYVMHRFNIPHFKSNILMAALVIQIVCALINIWWKISTHTAAIGGVAGALMAFSALFLFNPVGWLCVVTVLGGMVGTSRMVLRQHTLAQVCAGYVVGWLSAIVVIPFV